MSIFSIKIVRIDFNMFSTLQIYFSSKVKKTCLVYSKPFIVDILRSVSQHHGIIWPFIRFRAPSFLQISFGHLYTGVNELVLPPIVISYVRLSASVYRFRNLEKRNVSFNWNFYTFVILFNALYVFINEFWDESSIKANAKNYQTTSQKCLHPDFFSNSLRILLPFNSLTKFRLESLKNIFKKGAGIVGAICSLS